MRAPGRSGRASFAAWLGVALACYAPAAPATVSVHLEVHDELTASGLAVSIHRDIPQGTDVLAFVESIVAVDYRRYPGVGVFITSLCGVAAPDGMFWALSVNGERATRGLADLHLEADTHIRWDLVPLR